MTPTALFAQTIYIYIYLRGSHKIYSSRTSEIAINKKKTVIKIHAASVVCLCVCGTYFPLSSAQRVEFKCERPEKGVSGFKNMRRAKAVSM